VVVGCCFSLAAPLSVAAGRGNLLLASPVFEFPLFLFPSVSARLARRPTTKMRSKANQRMDLSKHITLQYKRGKKSESPPKRVEVERVELESLAGLVKKSAFPVWKIGL